MQTLKFADCNREFQDAKIVILGVPFDATSSFRAGSRHAPNAVREASWNFESYIQELDVDLAALPVCDLGNLEEFGKAESMLKALEFEVCKIIEKNKFPILLGGEHTLTIGVVKALKKQYKEFSVMILDAHLDFRNEYLGVKNSHACVTRRISEEIGCENVYSFGVRSLSKEEKVSSEKLKLKYFTVSELREKKISNIIKNLNLKEKIYLSLDFDVIDPSFAPGVSNPEPLGLNLNEILNCIKLLSSKLVGFDIVEVCPSYDNSGITSILAAKTIQYLVASVWRVSKIE
ncbi:MAG: agmatinase [Candidatus Thermoplasmatota archaeon]